MLSCGALQRSNNIYIESIMETVFLRIREILAMWVWLGRKSWKKAEAMEKSTMSWKQNLCLSVRAYVFARACVCVCVCVCARVFVSYAHL